MKYKLTDETINFEGRTLYRIECIKPFLNIKIGEKGGYVESKNNLSQFGNAWVGGNAKVFGDAWVSGNAKVCDNAHVYCGAKVYDNAEVFGDAWVGGNAKVCDNAHVACDAMVFGNAKVCGDAMVFGNAKVCGDAKVCGNAWVCGNAKIEKTADYIVFKNHWSSGRFFTWTRSNGMWKVGCFYGTSEELIKKAYADSEDSGKHYEAYVRFVEQLKQI